MFNELYRALLSMALSQQPMKEWSSIVLAKKENLAQKVSSSTGSMLTKHVRDWSPIKCANMNANQPHRRRVHPRRRWDDVLL